MHYRDLQITHKAFWNIERRAKHYDTYMKEVKDWQKWPDSVSLEEIRKLLKFIPKWDPHFRVKDPKKFDKVYKEILPIIRELKNERLENTKFNTELMRKIQKIFAIPRVLRAWHSIDRSRLGMGTIKARAYF